MLITNTLILDLKAKKPPMSIRRENRAQKFYSTLPKNKSKLMLCYEVGELNFRRSRRQESLKKYGNFDCLVPFCRKKTLSFTFKDAQVILLDSRRGLVHISS